MVDAHPKPAVPGGVDAHDLQHVLSELEASLALLRSVAESTVVSDPLRAEATSLIRELHGAFEARPIRVGVVGSTSDAAWAWVHASVGLAEAPRPDSLVVWRAERHVLEVIRRDGARFDLDGLSPDPGPDLRTSLAADQARVADVETVRVSVRQELDTAVASLAERTARKAEVEAGLEKEREALASAQARLRALEASVLPADAYLAACTTTVPAVLRRDAAGVWDRLLQALLPVLFSADLRAWRSAVARRGALETEQAAARLEAGETETRLVRGRRERVALMNETVRLQGEVSRLRAEAAALDAEHETVQSRVEASQAALAALPAERAAAWAAALEAHGGAPETQTLRLASPDLPLPEGLALCVGPDDAGDVTLLLEGAVRETVGDERVEVEAGTGGLEELRNRAARRHVLAAARRTGVRGGRLAASLAAEVADGPGRDAAARGALRALVPRWSHALVADLLAQGADTRTRAAERMLHAAAARVPGAMAGAREAVVAPLAELHDVAAIAAASAGLASAVQTRVDQAAQTILSGVAADVRAWLAAAIETAAEAENATLVGLGGAAVEVPPVERISLDGVMPDITVAPTTGLVGGPLLRLRAAGELRAEADASVRAAVEQATVQLQARLMGAGVPLCRSLERGFVAGLEGLCGRLDLARAAREADLEDGAEARAEARSDLATMADALASHARSLAEGPGETQAR